MPERRRRGRARIAVVTAVSLAMSPSLSLAQTAPAAAAAAPSAPKPEDRGWPRAYAVPSGGAMTLYQPQLASWEGQKHMVAYSAVSYQPTGAPKPHLGSVKLEADTKVSTQERLVNFSSLKISEANFPTLGKEKTAEIVKEIDNAVPDEDRIISLDRVMAAVDRSQILPKNVEGVKADPPTVFFSKRPAMLVNIDGEPIWSPIKENDLKFAVNTNWDLFQHEPTKTFYVRYEQSWLQATDVKGPWTAVKKLPDSFKRLPADDNWKEVKAAVPGKKLSADKAPQVFVSFMPAEMILLTGEPKYTPVAGTGLLWVENTEADLFRFGQTGPVYYLVAGRWFSGPDFTGPWTFVTPKLPPDFQKIPLEHPRSRVLASVPGSQQAAEAVLLAQIPQTARVNKKQLKAPEVTYAGDPKFEKIDKTKVERAVNTDKSIIKVGDMYYMCYEGVWFMGSSANGPWSVASNVPGEIYEIPISSPAHNVTYVTVEDDDDDEWVTFASAAMYTGVMVAWGCAVWGGGYYYPPYYGGFYGGYPMYYGHYPTYGYGASYNPWTGAYGRSAVAYGPYGGAGVSARYNPRTGTYSRGAAAYGPYGSRAAGTAYNPRTGAYGATRQGSNVYGSWGSTAVQRGDQWATTSRATSNVTGATTRTTRTSSGAAAATRTGPGGSAGVARTAGGDVYAGRDGNVYRNDGSGWQKHDGSGGWTSASGGGGGAASAATTDQLSRDRAARSEGTQRSRDYGSYRSGSSSGSSYRSSGSRGGGGMRGGGRRR